VKFRLLAVGTRMPDWVTQGFEDYNRRLPADFALHLQEIPLSRRSKNAGPQVAVRKESEVMLGHIQSGNYVIALDVEGRQFSTAEFARRLEFLRVQGRDVALLVGGPDGLGAECLARADERWSLSSLTLPHPLVRIVLGEQFYRSWSLLQNHPYHRE
jgi:23S rRNA (pseudouridine1915-N3)-methyltransferase